MNRVLIVCNTVDSAKRQFNDIAQQAQTAFARASQNELMIEMEDTQYQFMSLSKVTPDRLMGRTYHTVIIDEAVQLTNEQRAMIISRER